MRAFIVVFVLGLVRVVSAAADEQEQAIAHYRSGDYAAALTEFQRAYATKPTAALLFNIAQAHRMLGQTSDALVYYRRYVDEAAPSPVRDDAERFVEALSTNERNEAKNERNEANEHPAAPPLIALVPLSPPPAPLPVVERRGVTRGGAVALVATTAGLGIAMLSIGAGLAVHARDVSASLEMTPPGAMWAPTYRGRYEDGQASAQASTALFVLGAGAIATSVTSAIVFRRAFRERAVQAAQPPSHWTF